MPATQEVGKFVSVLKSTAKSLEDQYKSEYPDNRTLESVAAFINQHKERIHKLVDTLKSDIQTDHLLVSKLELEKAIYEFWVSLGENLRKLSKDKPA